MGLLYVISCSHSVKGPAHWDPAHAAKRQARSLKKQKAQTVFGLALLGGVRVSCKFYRVQPRRTKTGMDKGRMARAGGYQHGEQNK